MKCLTDYLIMLSLPDRIDQHIKRYKMSCAKHIGKFKGQYNQGHIAFSILRDESQKPFQPSHNMALYLDAVSKAFDDVEPRKLYIKDFNFFSHGPRLRTIYAAVIMDNHTKDWFARIDRKLNISKQTVPYITIAKNIPVEQFDILWPFFKNINYEEAFYSEELTILQKEVNGTNAIYRPYKRIVFGDKKPSPVSNSY